MTTQSNDIIIVGAGPTGLMLANQLTRFGIDYIILDQKAGPTDQSRALVVHARSMEIYQQMGLSDQVLVDGQQNGGITLYRNGKQTGSVNLINVGENKSPFPFMMMYEQSKNETLLYNNLLAQNRSVQWNTTINSITKENDSYSLKATQSNNDIIFQCKYLIACDGSKSIVRDFSQVPFTGGTYEDVFYVTDTHVNAGLTSERLSLFLSNRSITMFFPIKGDYRFRVLGVLPKEYYKRNDIPFEEIMNNIKTEIQKPMDFYDTNWHSTYKLHHKKVTHFSKDNIFFAGDAAHVHSPAGGQGMNTGLQDVYNLAWKLALVQKGKAAQELLATYHEERNPVAEQLLKTTDKLFSAIISDNFYHTILRLYIVPFFVPLVTKLRFVRRLMFLTVSQIQISYLSSSLSKGKARKIKGGMRLPYFFVTQNDTAISIYDLIKEKAINPFTILVYNTPADSFVELNTSFFNLLPIEVNKTNDANLKKIGLPNSFVIVVRPDNYIAYISTKVNANELRNFITEAYFLSKG
jgi:2-polyprenyl-6-methoxyphenol hydroxylase-like FAD-dependent oxidoreductase